MRSAILFISAAVGLGVLVALTANPAPADSCRAVRQRVVVQHHAAAVVVKEAVVATFAAVPVYVPAYGVGYDHGGAELQALRREIAELKGALLKGPAGAPSPPAPPASDVQARAVQLLSQHCAKCHTGATSKGGLKMFDAPGQFSATLNALDVVAIEKAVKDGTMPPAPAKPLEDAEYLAVELWSKAIVATARKAAVRK